MSALEQPTAADRGLVTITERHLLLVEGPGDQRFFAALLKSLGLSAQVHHVGGKGEYPKVLKSLKLTEGFASLRVLCVIRDSDTDPSRTFKATRDALERAGLPAPTKPMSRSRRRRFCPITAVVLVPGPARKGALEDLCMEAVRGDGAIPCVEAFFKCLHGAGIHTASNLSKAKAHAFLASREKPGLRVGEAAECGYWPWDAPVFAPLVRFLKHLVGEQ